MNDVYLVVSEGWSGGCKSRCVLAGSEDDARQAHAEHYPNDHIVAVKAQG
jgi:hypothetical protein